MTVRRLTAADAIAYRVVRLEALERHPESFGSTLADWASRPLSAYIRRMEDGVIFGAFTDRGLEGLIAYDRLTGAQSSHRAEIHQVYLRARLRGTGLAEEMLAKVVQQARVDGVLQLELVVAATNTHAHSFYANRGFVRTGVIPRALKIDETFVDEICMVRRLDD